MTPSFTSVSFFCLNGSLGVIFMVNPGGTPKPKKWRFLTLNPYTIWLVTPKKCSGSWFPHGCRSFRIGSLNGIALPLPRFPGSFPPFRLGNLSPVMLLQVPLPSILADTPGEVKEINELVGGFNQPPTSKNMIVKNGDLIFPKYTGWKFQTTFELPPPSPIVLLFFYIFLLLLSSRCFRGGKKNLQILEATLE